MDRTEDGQICCFKKDRSFSACTALLKQATDVLDNEQLPGNTSQIFKSGICKSYGSSYFMNENNYGDSKFFDIFTVNTFL